MADKDIALMAHLMRRAGFGASRSELEERVAGGYEATVEELLRPEDQEPVDVLDLFRYQPWAWKPGTVQGMGHASWTFRLINTRAPLQEKIALFWHQVFATGVSKVDHWDEIMDMIDLFRDQGLDSFRDLLRAVAMNPAMIYWLDNNENHSYAVNENWGRELLELFSMGVGNYTEDDVRECSRAFTGWTITPKLPRYPMGRFDWHFEYRDDDHDHEKKSFLGHSGKFNGDDIIDIVCRQPATARFIARHLYNFFVADEAQVPAWSVTPPRDAEAIRVLESALIDNDYAMRPVLRLLFNSDFFKEAHFSRMKSPAEVVIGTLRLARRVGVPGARLRHPVQAGRIHGSGPDERAQRRGLAHGLRVDQQRIADETHQLLRGRHGRSGAARRAGYRAGLKSKGDMSPGEFVDSCLDIMGPLDVDDETRDELRGHAAEGGDVRWASDEDASTSTDRVSEMLQLIVSLREYQFA